MLENVPTTQEKACACDEKTGYRHQLQRSAAKTDKTVQPNLKRAGQPVIVASPGEALISVVFNESLLESNIRHQTAQKAMRLIQLPQLFDDTPCHDAKVPSVAWDLNVTESVDKCVTKIRNNSLRHRFTPARSTLGIDDFVALGQLGMELFDQVRRILQINIDHHTGFT